MNPVWAAISSVVVVLLVQFGTTAYLAGKVVGKVAELDGRMTRNEKTDENQWQSINDQHTSLANIKGRLKINGQ